MKVKEFIVTKVMEISNVKGLPEISLETNLFSDLNFDSLMIIQLIMEIEDQYSINTDEYLSSFDDFETIGALCKIIEKAITNKE